MILNNSILKLCPYKFLWTKLVTLIFKCSVNPVYKPFTIHCHWKQICWNFIDSLLDPYQTLYHNFQQYNILWIALFSWFSWRVRSTNSSTNEKAKFLYEQWRKTLWPWILNPTNVSFLFNPRKLVPTKIKPYTVLHKGLHKARHSS